MKMVKSSSVRLAKSGRIFVGKTVFGRVTTISPGDAE